MVWVVVAKLVSGVPLVCSAMVISVVSAVLTVLSGLVFEVRGVIVSAAKVDV